VSSGEAGPRHGEAARRAMAKKQTQNLVRMPQETTKTESARIQKVRAKTVYADFLRHSCAPTYSLESGSAAANAESSLLLLKEGGVYTSCSDAACLRERSCPVALPVVSVPTIITTGLLLQFEAGDSSSYPGSGTTWINIGTGGSTYNATLAGSGPGVGLPTFSAGPPATFNFIRYALVDGSSYTTYNRISLVNPPGIGDDFSYCAWIKTTQVGQGLNHYQLMYILSTETGGVNNDFGFGIDVNGKLAYGDGKTGGSDITLRTTASVNTGAWIFVSVTRQKSTGTVTLYINGLADTTGTCNSGNSLTTGTDIVIGSEKDFPGYTMGGQIASVLGNTSVLTAAQILQNYTATKATYGY
jgi:hypothetical protein